MLNCWCIIRSTTILWCWYLDCKERHKNNSAALFTEKVIRDAPGQRRCEKNASKKMPKTAEQHHPTKERYSRKRGVKVCEQSFTSTDGEVALVSLKRKTLETSYSQSMLWMFLGWRNKNFCEKLIYLQTDCEVNPFRMIHRKTRCCATSANSKLANNNKNLVEDGKGQQMWWECGSGRIFEFCSGK